ncbi:hypothetical protein SAMN05880558_112139 [Aeromonas sp. RU39B]|uniref:hypothetical protein n=1 Tax=Aeromonas sp. RU39B TaxID=1907416 RepID=UPI000954A92E|nr:hypothetical protein [Aeromonas sp. RU39B]SIR37764.1 hypothetical protein SAMN05880558_112139 [Aeromonas sp. RU39B]
MRIEDPINYFGSATKAAAAIGYAKVCFGYWRNKNNGIVSERAAMRFVEVTNGALELGIEDYSVQPKQEERKQAA